MKLFYSDDVLFEDVLFEDVVLLLTVRLFDVGVGDDVLSGSIISYVL